MTASGRRSGAPGTQIRVYQWYVDGQPTSREPEITVKLSPGIHQLRLIVLDSRNQETQASARVVIVELSAKVLGVEPRATATTIGLGVQVQHTGPIYLVCEFRAGRQVVVRAPQRIDGSGDKRLAPCGVSYQELEAQRPAPGQAPVPIDSSIVLLQDLRGGELHRWQGRIGQLAPKTNVAPVARFDLEAGGRRVQENQQMDIVVPKGSQVAVKLSGARSQDPDGKIVRYRWDLNGAPVAEQPELTRPLPPGTYQVRLTVFDDRGATSAAEARLIIRESPSPQEPKVVVQPGSVAVGGAVQVLGTGFTPGGTVTVHVRRPTGTILGYANPKPGSDGAFATPFVVPTGQPTGPYTVWAVDERTGRKSNEATFAWGLVGPTVTARIDATAQGQTAREGGELRIIVPASSPRATVALSAARSEPTAAIRRYSWEGLAGVLGEGREVTPSLPAGSYVVTLTVRTAEGASAQTKLRIVILAPPVAHIDATAQSQRAQEGQELRLSVPRSSPQAVVSLAAARSEHTGDGAQYVWQSDGVAIGSEREVSRPFSVGTYLVTLTARTAAGQSQAQVRITVQAQPDPTPPVTARIDATAAGQSAQENGELRVVARPGQREASVTLSARRSQPPGAEFLWQTPGTQLGSGPEISRAFQVGTQIVTLTMRPPQGAAMQAQVRITVVAEGTPAPVARIDATAQGQRAQENGELHVTVPGAAQQDARVPVTLSAARSEAAGSARYTWYLGPNLLGQGRDVTASLPVGGHLVRLFVEDSRAQTAQAQLRVSVSRGTSTSGVVAKIDAMGQSLMARENSELRLTVPAGSRDVVVDLSGARSEAAIPIAAYAWQEQGRAIGLGREIRVPFAPGTHDITLTVTDVRGAAAQASLRVTVAPSVQPPVEVAPRITVNPTTTAPGGLVQVTARGFSPGATANLHQRGPDGREAGLQGVSTSAEGAFSTGVTVPPGQIPGSYSLWAVDMRTGRRSNEAQYGVTSSAAATPAAHIDATAQAYRAQENGELRLTVPAGARAVVVSLSAARSEVPGAGFQYAWQSQGGVLGNQRDIMAALPSGSHIVTLTVRNAQGATAQARVSIMIATAGPGSAPPQLTLNPANTAVGASTTLSGTGFTPSGTVAVHVRAPSGAELPVQRSGVAREGWFNAAISVPAGQPAGTYTVWAVDEVTGRRSADTSLVVTATPSPLIARMDASAAGQKAQEGQELRVAVAGGQEAQVTLSGARSQPEGRIVQYIWQRESQVLGIGRDLTRPFSIGTYVITLMVRDAQGASAQTQVRVVVGAGPATGSPGGTPKPMSIPSIRRVFATDARGSEAREFQVGDVIRCGVEYDTSHAVPGAPGPYVLRWYVYDPQRPGNTVYDKVEWTIAEVRRATSAVERSLVIAHEYRATRPGSFVCRVAGFEGEFDPGPRPTTLPPRWSSAEVAIVVKARAASGPGDVPMAVRLSVSKTGNGSGTIAADKEGIRCAGGDGDVCSRDLAYGASVTLVATPASGANDVFAGWSGACAGTAPTCTLNMTQARNVTATFNRRSPPQVSIAPSSVAIGDTLQYTGTGFTPNATATLEVRSAARATATWRVATKPDGTFSESSVRTPGLSGAGTYTFSAVDDRTGRRSSEASFAVVARVDLKIHASALGRSEENGELHLRVPAGVEVKVALSGNGPASSGGRYGWKINGIQQVSGNPTLIHSFPGSSPAALYKVELTVFRSLVESKTAELNIRVEDNDKQGCRGRLGRGCSGGITQDLTISPSEVSQNDSCGGSGRSCFLVSSIVSMGSIKHDQCCDIAQKWNSRKPGEAVNPQMCFLGGETSKTLCDPQWVQAKWDWVLLHPDAIRTPGVQSYWVHEWTYGKEDTTDPPANSLRALSGTVVSQLNPQSDAKYCRSGNVVQTPVVYDKLVVDARARVFLAVPNLINEDRARFSAADPTRGTLTWVCQ